MRPAAGPARPGTGDLWQQAQVSDGRRRTRRSSGCARITTEAVCFRYRSDIGGSMRAAAPGRWSRRVACISGSGTVVARHHYWCRGLAPTGSSVARVGRRRCWMAAG
jgi:hypothetical protein